MAFRPLSTQALCAPYISISVDTSWLAFNYYIQLHAWSVDGTTINDLSRTTNKPEAGHCQDAV